VKLCATEQEGFRLYKCKLYFFCLEYISTQAPIPSSIPDFWRMIWEQEVPVIIMLTKLFERGQIIKAHTYWSKTIGETMNCGDISLYSLTLKLKLIRLTSNISYL